MDVLVRGSCPRERIGRSISLLSIPFLLLLLRHSPSHVFTFFLSRFPFLSSPFLSNVFSSLSLSVTQVRMVAGQFWMAENETGSNGCNSRDAVNATLRRKSRPFFHGNARVKSRRGTRYFVLSVYRSFRRKISCRLRVNIGLATK